jgi:outer membrane protein assembly factor BamB
VPDDQRRRQTLIGLVVVCLVATGIAALLDQADDTSARRTSTEAVQGSDPAADGGAPEDEAGDGGEGQDGSGDATGETPEAEPAADDRFFTSDHDAWVDPAGSGKPYPNAAIEGLLTFRGNPSRSYYGVGPVPGDQPEILHSFPESPMCMSSSNLGETKVWCGMGWTGQPLVFDRDGRRWVVFGAYDGAVHFMDGITGERILPDVPTGDLIKGTGTVDPDGNPLVYIGSRDNKLRVIAIDRPGQAEVLWSLDAHEHPPTMWNDDWDSSPIVIGDYLLAGSENSRWYVIKLNRGTGSDGLVTVAPEVVFTAPGWDDELLSVLPDRAVSIEASMTVVGDTVYFANSGGLVQGWDVGGLEEGREPERVFRFWTGDDTDATIVGDDEGHLYVAVEWERGLDRAREVGQLVKLDPSEPDDPIVWSVDDTGVMPGGMWGTPGIWEDTVYVGTNGGRLLGVDRATGDIRWEKQIPGPVWGSPVVVDGVLLIGDCDGLLHAYDVSDTGVEPPELWSVDLGGCIEATPAVWDGRIYLGSRAGHLTTIGDPAHEPTVTAG